MDNSKDQPDNNEAVESESKEKPEEKDKKPEKEKEKEKEKPKLYRKSMRLKGKLISAYGATEAEAAVKLVEKVKAMESGYDEMGAQMTVTEWYYKYKNLYRAHKGLTAATLNAYDGKFKNYIAPKIGNMHMGDVRYFHLQEILNESEGKSSSHILKLHMMIRDIFEHAYAFQIIFRDPSVGLEIPGGTYKGHRVLTEKEREALYKVARVHPAGPWVVTLLTTGMRPGESIALVWADIRFDLNEINIHCAKESGSSRIKAPKTDAGIRIIPMRPMLRELLLPLVRNPDDPVFPNAHGKFMSTVTMYALWKSFKKALDIELGAPVDENGEVIESLIPDLKPYSLRHTFCSDLERGSVPLNIAKRLMGHSDIGTTSNIYTHTDREMLHKSMEMYDKVAGGFPAPAAPDSENSEPSTHSASASDGETKEKH